MNATILLNLVKLAGEEFAKFAESHPQEVSAVLQDLIQIGFAELQGLIAAKKPAA